MDGRRFDAWTRRAALRLQAGAGAGVAAQEGSRVAAAACVPAGRRCGDGKHCCHDAACKGGRCRCEPGVVACFAGMWRHDCCRPAWLTSPTGVAVDRAGRVYVVDNWRVYKFSGTGKFVTKWGRQGSGDGEFDLLFGVAVAAVGNGTVVVYVADGRNNRVQRFDGDGRFLGEWGGGDWGEFAGPYGVAADGTGNVYVVSGWSLLKFDADGTFLMQVGEAGYGEGQLALLNGVAVDGVGHVYVAGGAWETGENRWTAYQRVTKFDGEGRLLGQWGREGTGPGEFRIPRAVAVHGTARVYVADAENDRVQKFLLA